jgi:hypothetical protein
MEPGVKHAARVYCLLTTAVKSERSRLLQHPPLPLRDARTVQQRHEHARSGTLHDNSLEGTRLSM